MSDQKVAGLKVHGITSGCIEGRAEGDKRFAVMFKDEVHKT